MDIWRKYDDHDYQLRINNDQEEQLFISKTYFPYTAQIFRIEINAKKVYTKNHCYFGLGLS